jgi:effector-binding domain-containing protein
MLKESVEKGQVLSKTRIAGLQDVGPLRVIGLRESRALAEIGPAMERAFAMAADAIGDVPADCLAVSVYHTFDVKTQICDYTSGFALPESTATPPGLNAWSIPRMRALQVEHTGAYHHLGNAWSAGHQFARYKKIKLSREAGYEVYLNDPHQTPPADLRTDVFLLTR